MILLLVPLFIGTTELLLIGGMALLLFGGKKLPEMMRGLGQGVKEFKKGMSEIKNSSAKNISEENAEVTDSEIEPNNGLENNDDKKEVKTKNE